MSDSQIIAAIIAAIISSIGILVNFVISFKRMGEKKDELDTYFKIQFDKLKNEVAFKQKELEQELLILKQEQLSEILKKRIEVYPKLWQINLKYWRHWYLSGKKRDKIWLNNWLNELNEFNESNGLFFSQDTFEKFSELRDIIIEASGYLEENDELPQERLLQISEIISGKSRPGLSTIMKDDLGSFSSIFLQKRSEKDYKEEISENDEYFALNKQKRKELIKAEIINDESIISGSKVSVNKSITQKPLNHSQLDILNYSEKGIISNSTPSLKSTGIFALDNILGGGVVCGSVVNISVDPRSMAEVWLYQIAQQDQTYYFTTEKKSADIQYSIYLRNLDYKNINFIDINAIYVDDKMSSEDILNLTENYLDKIARESQTGPIIIFDNFSFYLNLDINLKRFKAFIGHIIQKTNEIQGISYLYTIKQKNEFENNIYYSSDFIFNIELEQNVDKIINKLSILKNKIGPTPQEIIKIKFSDAIEIDTTCEIA